MERKIEYIVGAVVLTAPVIITYLLYRKSVFGVVFVAGYVLGVAFMAIWLVIQEWMDKRMEKKTEEKELKEIAKLVGDEKDKMLELQS